MSAHFSLTEELYVILQINWKYKALIMDNIDSIILVVAAADTRRLME